MRILISPRLLALLFFCFPITLVTTDYRSRNCSPRDAIHHKIQDFFLKIPLYSYISGLDTVSAGRPRWLLRMIVDRSDSK